MRSNSASTVRAEVVSGYSCDFPLFNYCSNRIAKFLSNEARCFKSNLYISDLIAKNGSNRDLNSNRD